MLWDKLKNAYPGVMDISPRISLRIFSFTHSRIQLLLNSTNGDLSGGLCSQMIAVNRIPFDGRYPAVEIQYGKVLF